MATATATAPLKIDKDKGIIYRVKVLGRFSRNSHGAAEAENGTEYTLQAMKSELPLIEGRKVKTDHPPDRTNPGKERTIDATFGVLRNCLIESDEHGDPAIWGDLHCLTTHPMYPRVLEDVEKQLGVYGLSHNAAASKERMDRDRGLLVIEEIGIVRSVDLVDKPATNRNLWEGHSSHHRGKRKPVVRRIQELTTLAPRQKSLTVRESRELVRLRGEKSARELCESLKFKPTQLQFESLAGLSNDRKRRAAIESLFRRKGNRVPRSADPDDDVATLRGDPGRPIPRAARSVSVEDALVALRGW